MLRPAPHSRAEKCLTQFSHHKKAFERVSVMEVLRKLRGLGDETANLKTAE